MSAENIPVKIRLPDNSLREGYFTLHHELPDSPGDVKLELSFLERKEGVVAPDFFAALAQLRKKLEAENVWLLCNGAVENVYPSGMARDMGAGLKAYNLTLGKQAKMADLVSVFENTLGLPPSPVQMQEAFYQKWLNSPRL